MNKLNQLVWRIANLTESYRKDLEPQSKVQVKHLRSRNSQKNLLHVDS